MKQKLILDSVGGHEWLSHFYFWFFKFSRSFKASQNNAFFSYYKDTWAGKT